MKPRLARAVHVMEANRWLQQFGQAHDESAWDGKVACTHTMCQALVLIWHNRRLTINQVSRLAGYPSHAKDANGNMRGMNAGELMRFFKNANLPYVVKFGMSAATMMSYGTRGPVLYANRYGSEPEWRGYIYHGTRADGRPNGYARPDKEAGKTQLSGYENGPHAVLLLGGIVPIVKDGKVVRQDAYRKDPNHRSASRPEKPAYDIITAGQVRKEYTDYHDRLGRKLYCAVPTRNLPV